MANHNISSGQVLYMGDDIPDLPVMKLVGLPACPSDAVPEVRDAAKYISPFNGGAGCVRDVIEKVLKAQNNWQHIDDLASR
jgi:3-deoxy-D-manno-octulosonate 8-phosphate phosphatase (KDO 8-P phosphatase)